MGWIRKNIYWIAGVMVVGMVLWLATSAVTVSTTQPESAGTLFGRSVPATDYIKALQASNHQAVLSYGDQMQQNISMDQLQEQAWERVLLLSEAKRKGIKVSDQEVVQEMQALPIFQDSDGRFDQQGYQIVMQYTLGTTPRAFEEEMRENLMIQKLVQQAIGEPAATEEEIKKRFTETGGAIQIEWTALPHLGLAREAADALQAEPGQMAGIARQAGSKMESTGFFKREEPVEGLESSSTIFRQLAGTEPGATAGPFRAGTGWAIARLKAKQPAEEKDFESARAGIEQDLISQKRLKNYLAWYQELVQRAKPQRRLNNAWPPAAG